MASFSITTLGCKVNQYDGQAVAQLLVQQGLVDARADGIGGQLTGPEGGWTATSGKLSPDDDNVRLVVINTCCVTATARSKSRQAIRRAVRASPGAAVLVLGCYSDYDAASIRQLLFSLGVGPQRAFVAGHHDDIAACVRRVAGLLTGPAGADCPQPAEAAQDAAGGLKARRQAALRRASCGTGGLPPIGRFAGHQRAFVKVQDGCDAFCSYCVVPYTRCLVRSEDIENVEAQCRRLVAAGHREIVLCGVFLGAFGRGTAIRRRLGRGERQRSPLAALVRRVAAIEGLWRVRLSSLEPGDLSEELLEVFRGSPAVAPHLHLPLQSGSGAILRRMNRQYSPDEYLRAVGDLKRALDRPAITTDIIVGFPGETDEDFRRTLDLARQAGFSKIHAFPFSPIRGTAAWSFRHEAPPPPLVARRMNKLQELERQLAAEYRRQFVGQTVEGLVEQRRNGLWQATTDRYLTVLFDSPIARPGQVARFEIAALHPQGLSGRLLPDR